jgi:hypothetical protein
MKRIGWHRQENSKLVLIPHARHKYVFAVGGTSPLRGKSCV